MKQVLIDQGDWRAFSEDLPRPILTPGNVLVSVAHSVISSGTELSRVPMDERSLHAKARSRPDLVHAALDVVPREGLKALVGVVRDRLSTPKPLGHKAGGTVREVGTDVASIVSSNLVACGGVGYAAHAEIVAVPASLCPPAPGGITSERAAFSTTAHHCIRQAETATGEFVDKARLGLVGQRATRLLVAYGHTVSGDDLPEETCSEVEVFIVDAMPPIAPELKHVLANAVLLTPAIRSSESLAAPPSWCRDRRRVVVVGSISLDLANATSCDFETKRCELFKVWTGCGNRTHGWSARPLCLNNAHLKEVAVPSPRKSGTGAGPSPSAVRRSEDLAYV